MEHKALNTEFKLFTDLFTKLQAVLPEIQDKPEYSELVSDLMDCYDIEAIYNLFSKLTETYDLQLSA